MSQSAARRSSRSCPHCKTVYPGGELFCPLDGTRLVSPSIGTEMLSTDPLLGMVVSGRYKILRRIGEGGMGIVYEAEHVVIEKRVALKVLRDDFSRRPELVERFRQEARSASRIGHDHIVDISDFGETPSGANYFVMEMLNGEDLAMLLQRESMVDPEFAVHIVLQCCRGLGAAHAKGIIHRDMKPENIFLVEREGRKDFVKLVDFGIAKMSDAETSGAPGRKLTKTGMIFGTPEYMSPEQAAGKALDHRVDIYAMGIILYELLAGRVPFLGDTFMGVLTQHMFEAPRPLREINPNVHVPQALESVVLKALAKDPNQRYRSMHEMAIAIQMAMGMEISAPSDTSGRFSASTTGAGGGHSRERISRITSRRYALADTTYLTTSKFSKKVWRVLAGVALALLGLGALGWGLRAYWPTERLSRSALSKGPTPSHTLPAVQAPALRPPPANAPAAPPEPLKAPEGSEQVHMVTVRVATQPSGAKLEVSGRGVVCEKTPCSFTTPSAELVTLNASLGNASVVHELSPEVDSYVTLQLQPRTPSRRPRPRAGHTDQDDEPKPSEAESPPSRNSGELKVPDIFR